MMRKLHLAAFAALLLPTVASAQMKASGSSKIQSALSAAPAAIAANATVMDWPAQEQGAPTELRRGTNGWTCFPDYPGTEGPDPMCLDETWIKFIKAHLAKEKPQIDRVAISYMVAPGGAHGSNTDPFAQSKTAGNEWGLHPPHVMIAVPDVNALRGLPTSHTNGGPYVMWAGTPYAHIMIPVDAAKK